MRLGYQVLLMAHHYDTCFAGDSLSAISEARKQQPDLILLDLGLPAGDGFVVIERLLTNLQLAMIPIVVVSARDVRINRQRALQAGAKAFVARRWDDHNLLQVIRDVLHGKIPAVTLVA